jgi:sulfur-oxidizing protein SoxX
MASVMGFVVVGMFAVSAQSAEMPNVTIVDQTIPASLTGKPGDAANGQKVVINRKKGNCLACHMMPIPKEEFHGQVGPNLDGVAERLDEAQLRMRLVDPKVVNSGTMMPSFYRNDLHRVSKAFVGKTILEAQEIEDVVAYLMTLK